MRNLVFIVAILLGVASCGNKTEKKQTAETKAFSGEYVYTIDSLLKVADGKLNQEVVVKGHVTHTCKHSGKRCFIVGEDQKTTLRVEAKGEIGGFNRELVGSELAIKGIVKERRLTKEYLDQYEKDVNDKKAQEDGSAESCEAELSNIKGMKDWMAENSKEYYSIYYIDGENYEVIEN